MRRLFFEGITEKSGLFRSGRLKGKTNGINQESSWKLSLFVKLSFGIGERVIVVSKSFLTLLFFFFFLCEERLFNLDGGGRNFSVSLPGLFKI